MEGIENKLKAIEVLTSLAEVNEEVLSIIGVNKRQLNGLLSRFKFEIDLGVYLLTCNYEHYRLPDVDCTNVYLTKYTLEKQPINIDLQDGEEWLIHFWFPCGSLSFISDIGSPCLHKTFEDMVGELKFLLQPKYFDGLNYHFYLEPSKVNVVTFVLDTVFNKYKHLAKMALKNAHEQQVESWVSQ